MTTSVFDLLPLDGADQQNNSSAGASLIGWNGTNVGNLLNNLSSVRQQQSISATSNGQNTFTTTGYTPGLINVYLAGTLLLPTTDYVATDGTSIVLTSGIAALVQIGTVLVVEGLTSYAVANAVQASALAGNNGAALVGYNGQTLAGIVSNLSNGTNTDAGTLTGSEVVTVSRGSGFLQKTLTGIAQWIIQTYQGFTQSGTGAVTRSIQSKLQETVSPLDFGAVGNGTTLDDAAFALLAALPSGTRIDGMGRTYLLSQPVVFNNQVDIKVKVKASSSFNQSGTILTFNADRSVLDIDTDSNNRCVNGVRINSNYCKGKVRGLNITGAPTAVGGGSQSVLTVYGNYCNLDVYGENLLVGTADNTSVPRVLSTLNNIGVTFNSIIGNNTVALWINSVGDVSVDYLYSYQCGNNGVYDIAPGSDIKIGTAIFESDLGLNLQTIISEGQVYCANLIARDCWGYAGVDFNGTLNIGNYTIDNSISSKVHQAIVSRASASNCNVRIGNLTGKFGMTAASNGGAVFQFYAGTINELEVGNIDVTLIYQTGSTTLLHNQTNGTNAKCSVGDMRIVLVDGTGSLTSATTFNWTFPTYSLPSWIGKIKLISSTGTLTLGNATQANMMTSAGMEIAQNTGTVVSTVTGTTPRVFYSTGIPTAGSFTRGDVIINKFAGYTSTAAWVCIGSGSPGTWTPFTQPVYRGTTAQRPSGLVYNDLGMMYMDNTLNSNGKPIFWNGSAWVDSTGATV